MRSASCFRSVDQNYRKLAVGDVEFFYHFASFVLKQIYNWAFCGRIFASNMKSQWKICVAFFGSREAEFGDVWFGLLKTCDV